MEKFLFVNTNNNSAVILRRPLALASGRLEGWPQARSLLPSFETATGKSAWPPQDDGGDRCGCSSLPVLFI
jgi:hypothetical protein